MNFIWNIGKRLSPAPLFRTTKEICHPIPQYEIRYISFCRLRSTCTAYSNKEIRFETSPFLQLMTQIYDHFETAKSSCSISSCNMLTDSTVPSSWYYKSLLLKDFTVITCRDVRNISRNNGWLYLQITYVVLKHNLYVKGTKIRQKIYKTQML